MIVQELFVKLGIQVDKAALDAANKAVQAVTTAAVKASDAFKGATDAAKPLAAATAAVGNSAAAAAERMAALTRQTEGASTAAERMAGIAGAAPANTAGNDATAAAARRMASLTGDADARDSNAAAARRMAAITASADGGDGGGGGPRKPGAGEIFKGWVGKIATVKTAIGGIGTALAANFAVQQVRQFTQEMVALGSSIQEVAGFTGMSTDAVQELGFAAKISSVPVDVLRTGLKNLTINSQQAAAGAEADAEAFALLGIDVLDSAGNVKSAEQLLLEASDAIAALESDSDRTAAAVRLFGNAGVGLVPLLKRGSGGIAELRAQARALGGGLSSETIATTAEFETSLIKLDQAMLAVKGTLANVLLPVLTAFNETLSKVVGWVKRTAEQTYFFEAALGTALVGALLIVIPLVQALTLAQLQAAASAALVALPYLLIVAAFVAFASAIDEIINLLKGNKSVIGKWIDEWAGIGTVDAFVRSWSEGIDSLVTSFKGLLTVGEAVWKIMKGLVTFNFKQTAEGVATIGNKTSEIASDVAQGAKAYVGNIMSVAGADLRNQLTNAAAASGTEPPGVAVGRDLNAGAVDKEFASIPQTVSSGLKAGRKLGSSGFGQARRSSSILNGPQVYQNNNLTVHTGADPKAVTAVVQNELGKQNRKVKAALVTKAPASQ